MDSILFLQLRERVRLLESQLGALVQRGEIIATDELRGRNPALSVQSHTGGPDTGLERIQDYGFASRPLPGAEAALLWLNGKRDAALVIATADRRYRLELREGEVALYDDRDQKVHLHDDGMNVTVKGTLDATVTGNARIDCPRTVLTGDLFVGGNLAVKGETSGDGGPLQMRGGINNETGDIVSNDISLEHHRTTDVQPGSGLSGEPV